MKIAALTDNLAPSQKSFYLIKEFNKLSQKSKNSCCVFTNISGSAVTKPLFACYSSAFLSEYNGAVIATSIAEAKTLLETSSSAKKYLYLWETEWTMAPINHDAACKIMRNPRLEIVARSESHAKAIENFCNRKPIEIVDDWNSHQLLKLIGGQNEN
jgi:hypothetical protein